MNKTYIISDTHFGHNNIIKYCNRPFENVDIMTKELINNWNSIVKKDDIVYHLGDIAMCISKGHVASIVNVLNGRIILIKGNHDNEKDQYYIDLFYMYYKYPIIINNVILSHEPIQNLDNTSFYNIHGHMHNTAEVHPELNMGKRHFNVSVECINYTPVLLDTVINNLKKQK